jgi:uncharacterized protein (TIGR02145 family)
MDMKTKTGFILIGLLALLFITCRKDKDDPTGGNEMELGANLIDTISYFFTGIQTEVISLGGNEIIQHGHCWNTEMNPTIEGNHTRLGNLTSIKDIQSVIDSLEPNTTFHIRPYIQTAYAVAYGDEEQIKTLKTGKPVVSSNLVSDITLTSALSGGIVTRDSGLVVTARGVCWDTTAVFRIDSCLGFTLDSLGLGSFSSEVTGLHEGTNYHIAAYATNEKGTGYGEVITFSTVPITPPVVVTTDITNITTTSAQSGGNVTSDGLGTVTLRGVCWDTLSTPTFENNIGHSENGSGLGEFTSNITNLHEGKTYYVVAYASNEKATGYGEIKNFTSTPIITPQVSTANITGITITTAQCGGNVTNNGNGLVTLRGVCWNNTGNPTLINSIGHTEDGSGLGTFTSNITGLEDGVTYYVIAYASNENETGYGEVKSFSTLPLTVPTLTTNAVTNITSNSAVSGGNVTNSGNGTVSARGVCWNTSGNPTLQNCIDSTSNGSGMGSFTSNITGLEDGVTYYVRAYAKNEEGSGYGNQVSFSTLPLTLPTVTTTAVTNITTNSAVSGGNVTNSGNGTVTTRGVCWNTSGDPTLQNCIDSTSNGSGVGSYASNITGLTENTTYYVRAYAKNEEGTGYGTQIIFTTLTIPTIITSAASNISYTTAASGGNVTDDGGSPVTARGVCWSTLPDPTTSDPHTNNGSGTGSFVSNITGLTQNTAYYVRAYAINSVGTAYGNQVSFTTLQITLPTVTTIPVTNITSTTAVSGGNVTDDGGATVTARGVCWSTNSNPTISDNFTIDGTGTGSFVSIITGLVPETDYYVRAYATNTIGTSYGSEFGFTTLTNPCPTLIIYEGQTYNTILIGTQCWFKENLNVGTMISGTIDQTNNGIKEKYCYNNNTDSCDTYGGLYQWNEMMDYSTTPGVQGICPAGWHLPSDEEWTILTTFLGGESIAGGKMKTIGTIEAGTGLWHTPNTGATNESGFTGLPGGYIVNNNYFEGLSNYGIFWFSTEENTDNAWYLELYYNLEEAYIYHYIKSDGFSVRCLKDE